MKTLTEAQAIKVANSKIYERWSYNQMVLFQVFEPRLCMPMSVFHKAVEKVLDRPVLSHMFGDKHYIETCVLKKLNRKASTFEERMSFFTKSELITILGDTNE